MIKIGLLTPRQGPAGIWSASAEASAILAVAEINVAGGLIGQELELVLADAGTTGRSAALAAADLVDIDEVDAIVALVPSYARRAISHAVAGRVPYIYTPQFEGHESDRGVVTVGETSKELLHPGIAWLANNKAVRRYYLVGNDYVWPRATFDEARHIIQSTGGIIVGETILPFGFDDYEPLLDKIRRAQPDVVMPYLLGYEAIGFNRAFAEASLARKILRFSSAIDETILYGLGADCTENLFVTSAYFSALRSRNNDAFLERYHSCFGETPPPMNGFGQSCYEGIHCLACLVASAGGLRPGDLRRGVGRAVQVRTARGFEARIVAGGSQPVHFAEVDGQEFRVRDPW